MPNNEQVDVICPYYLSHAKQSLTCETPWGTRITIRQKSYYHRERWMERYCYTFNYINCPNAQICDKKYGGHK